MILGKVGNVSSSNNNNNNNNNVSGPRNNNSNHGSSSDLSRNGLGGLFAGGMPKLKPTGRGYCKYLNMCCVMCVTAGKYSHSWNGFIV
jgi:hypothetical protein